jgi:GT2 family glycosyltransferase
MSALPLVSVLILNYNNKNLLEKCLGSVFRSDYPNFEVVFVDNASTDTSIEFVKARFGKESFLRIVQNSENLGYAGGNNAGIALAKGEYVVLLNTDTEVDENWLSELIKVMESDRNIGAAQCKLISMYERRRFDSAGGFIDRFGFPIVRGLQEEDVGQYDKVDEIFWAKGAAFAVRSNVLNEVGSFDNDFFLEYEETDLCWRIWLRGYRIVFVPKSVVFHVGKASISQGSGRINLTAQYHLHKNQIMSLLKNYELFNLIRYVPVVVFLKVLSDFESLKSYNFVRVKGIIYNLRNFDKIWKKRIKVQNEVRREKDAVIFKKRIITSFSLIAKEHFGISTS